MSALAAVSVTPPLLLWIKGGRCAGRARKCHGRNGVQCEFREPCPREALLLPAEGLLVRVLIGPGGSSSCPGRAATLNKTVCKARTSGHCKDVPENGAHSATTVFITGLFRQTAHKKGHDFLATKEEEKNIAHDRSLGRHREMYSMFR